MARKKTKKIIYLFLIIFLLTPLSIKAIGQVTKPIVIENGLRGEQTEVTLTLLNSAQKEEVYLLGAQGEIKEWVDFYSLDNKDEKITEIQVPPQSYLEATARINIPEDISSGEYKGEIIVKNKPIKEEGKNTVSVAQSISREVSINITNKEVISFQVSVIPEKYDLAEGEALQVRTIYNNQGNVSITPLMLIKISKDGEIVYNAPYPYPDNLEKIRPMSQKEITSLNLPTQNWEQGKYFVQMNFLINGEKHLEKYFHFSISEENVSVMGWNKWVNNLNNNKIIYSVLALFLVVIVSVAGVSLNYKKEKN